MATLVRQFKGNVKHFIYRWLGARPDFLVIGAQKAGTTSLYRYLSQHPEIVKNNSWKEIRYYDVPENYAKGYGWYLSNFPYRFSRQGRLTCDASPNYIYHQHVPQAIARDLGEIKMIAILREPASRAYSAWQMYHSFQTSELPHLREVADARTFIEAIEDDFKAESQEENHPFYYVDRGKYARQLKNYYQYFDPKNILTIFLDDFKKDLKGILDDICSFLEIQTFSQEVLDRIEQEKYNVGKYKAEIPPVDAEKIAELKAYFAPYNEELYQLVGRRYDW